MALKPERSISLVSSVTTAELDDDERRILDHLAGQLGNDRADRALSDCYYKGLQDVPSLGISTPPELKDLATIMGWARSGVDAVTERLHVQGFRMPDATSTDADLQSIWQANNLDDEQTLVHDDAQIFGVAFAVVGASPDGKDEPPLITIESPLTMTAVFDNRRRVASCALQSFIDNDPTSEFFQRWRAALYVRGATIHLVAEVGGAWRVTGRDDHRTKLGVDVVPVVPFLNARRTGMGGRSEISEAWRNTINRACRAQMRLEVTSEFFIAPKMIILGAAEEDFQNSDGTTKTAWETYTGRVLGLQRADDGTVPTVERFASESPDGLIKVVDQETKNMAGLTGLPPHYLGIFSDGNPASADAIRMSDFRLKMKSDRKTVGFGNSWEQVMRLALLVRDGELPDNANAIETDWAYTGIPTPTADTDAVTKQVSVGMVPPTSDVALSKVGYSAVERERIANEAKRQAGMGALERILNQGQEGGAVRGADESRGSLGPQVEG